MNYTAQPIDVPAILTRSGTYLYGAQWQGPLSRALNVSRKRIVSGLTGTYRGTFPVGILHEIRALVVEKELNGGPDASDVLALMSELPEQLPADPSGNRTSS